MESRGSPRELARNTGTGRAGAGRATLSAVHTPPAANCSVSALEKGIYRNRWKFKRREKSQVRISSEGNMEQVEFAARKVPWRAPIPFILLMLLPGRG